jgi:hypothetical protein
MSGKQVLVALAITAALVVLGAASAAANDHDRGDRGRERGGVIPCSLDGVNPAVHPEIFGNAATAQQFGFVQWPDRTWHVRPGCRR